MLSNIYTFAFVLRDGEADQHLNIYSCLSIFSGDGCQDLEDIKMLDSQLPYIRFCSVCIKPAQSYIL